MARAAIFDLDHTLTRHETLITWTVALRGPVCVGWAGLLAASLHRNREAPGAEDRQGRIKAAYLEHLLRGQPVEAAERATEKLITQVRWNAAVLERLKAHRAGGDHIVIATGALTLYAEALMESTGGADAVLGTDLDIHGPRLTGRMCGSNNARQAKADRLRGWLAAEGPFEHLTGYGNLPDDGPMLGLCDTAFAVDRRSGQMTEITDRTVLERFAFEAKA